LKYPAYGQQHNVTQPEFHVLILLKESRNNQIDHHINRHYPHRQQYKLERICININSTTGPYETEKEKVAGPKQNVSKDPGIEDVVFHVIQLLFVTNKDVFEGIYVLME
jgi:hypothetical protein